MRKLLFKYSKPYKKEFFIALIGVTFEAALELSCPFLMNLILQDGIILNPDGLTYSIDIPFLITISIIMVVCGVLAFVFGVIFAKYVAIYSKAVGYEIRKEEYKKISSYSFHNLDNISTSSLLTRLTNDIQIISDTISNSFRPLFRSPVMMIGTLIVAAITSPELSLVFFIAIPLLALIMFFIVKSAKPKFLQIQKIVDKMNSTTKEDIVSIRTIKSYVKENYEVERFKKINEQSRLISNKASGINALMMPAQELVLYATIVGILFLGGYLNQKPEFAYIVLSISMFLTYVNQLLATVQMFTNVALQFNRAEASVTRVNQVFDINSELVDDKDSKLVVKSGDVTFKNVSFSYSDDKNYVLSNINFTINNGDFIGIVGQTGSSKTTLINLLLRFYDVSDGEILIDGNNIKKYSLHELRKNIAVSFQNPFLFNDTVKNNIKWGKKDATDEEVYRAAKIACCYDFITKDLKDGFDTMISEGGTNLSGGQRQRVCLARAILLHPKILILDDSFSALDRLTETKVKENLKRECSDITKIVISQKISTIKDCDNIIVLEKGHITHIGTHSYLNDVDEIYKDINAIQNEGL